MTASCKGDCIAMFPEGTTHDREALAPIRTGAARIALGSVSAGATGVTIVPIGLSYGDKTRLRNDVLVAGGPPILVGDEGEDDHVAVRAAHRPGSRGASMRSCLASRIPSTCGPSSGPRAVAERVGRPRARPGRPPR